jgi:hypothetical protein
MNKIDCRWSVRHVIAAALAAAALLGASAGCKSLGLPDNRLMNCESNDDCKAADPKKPLCANLRCVQCSYDSDCPDGGVCDNFECKTLWKPPADTGPEEPPANRDACLSRCKDDSACIKKCDEQFKAEEPPKDDPAKKDPAKKSPK